jgi:hypothetical protein
LAIRAEAAKLNYKTFHLYAHKTPACLLFPTEHIVNYLPTNLIIAANNRLSVRWLFISFTPFANDASANVLELSSSLSFSLSLLAVKPHLLATIFHLTASFFD